MAVTIVSGGGGTQEIEIRETPFYIKHEGQDLHPALVTNLEIENSGDSETITVDCGDTERRKTANKGWVVTVEGLVTTNDVREDNLSLQKLRDVIAPSDVVEIRSPILSGTIVMSNVIIGTPENAVEIKTDRTWDRESVWSFRMTLGEEESDNG